MARLDRAIQPARVCAPNESCDHLDGPLLRAMTCQMGGARAYKKSRPKSKVFALCVMAPEDM
jgi:hypothetical protein